jgi:hypothetical protein
LKYDFSIGWYSTGVAKYHEDIQEYLDGVDSDLAVLHNRCMANNIDSIIDFNSAGTPYIRSHIHVDLHNILANQWCKLLFLRTPIELSGLMKY